MHEVACDNRNRNLLSVQDVIQFHAYRQRNTHTHTFVAFRQCWRCISFGIFGTHLPKCASNNCDTKQCWEIKSQIYQTTAMRVQNLTQNKSTTKMLWSVLPFRFVFAASWLQAATVVLEDNSVCGRYGGGLCLTTMFRAKLTSPANYSNCFCSIFPFVLSFFCVNASVSFGPR